MTKKNILKFVFKRTYHRHIKRINILIKNIIYSIIKFIKNFFYKASLNTVKTFLMVISPKNKIRLPKFIEIDDHKVSHCD